MTHKNPHSLWQDACLISRIVSSSIRVSEAAGGVIKKIMTSGNLGVINKSDDEKISDPQTEADRAAQYCIENSLRQKFGNKLKIIGEEEITSANSLVELGFSTEVLEMDIKCKGDLRSIQENDLVVWVDPLDGTFEFVGAQTDSNMLSQVTVLIGIAHRGNPIAGVIHQPFFGDQGRTIWGIIGVGAFGIKHQPGTFKEKTIVTSKNHFIPALQDVLDIFINKELVTTVEKIGGAGYKAIRCMEGACAYLAGAGCKKWDTAAPQAVLTALGGRMTEITGKEIYYGSDANHRHNAALLATAPGLDHQGLIDAIPDSIKAALSEGDTELGNANKFLDPKRLVARDLFYAKQLEMIH